MGAGEFPSITRAMVVVVVEVVVVVVSSTVLVPTFCGAGAGGHVTPTDAAAALLSWLGSGVSDVTVACSFVTTPHRTVAFDVTVTVKDPPGSSMPMSHRRVFASIAARGRLDHCFDFFLDDFAFAGFFDVRLLDHRLREAPREPGREFVGEHDPFGGVGSAVRHGERERHGRALGHRRGAARLRH